MVFFEGKCKYTSFTPKSSKGINRNKELCINEKDIGTHSDIRRVWSNKVREINTELERHFSPKDGLSVFVLGGEVESLDIIIACSIEKIKLDKIAELLQKFMQNNFYVKDVKIFEIKEITIERFMDDGNRADRYGYIHNFSCVCEDLNIGYFRNRDFKYKEYIVKEENRSGENALSYARANMAHETLIEELGRIYDEKNVKEYYGNPVHYKIESSNVKVVQDVVNMLADSLYLNKRIISRRITWIKDIEEGCYDIEDFDFLLMNAAGGIAVIEMQGSDEDHGNYATSFHKVIEYIGKQIKKYHLNTLFVFFENTEHLGFSKSLIGEIQDDIDIVEIKEGSGTKEIALDCLRRVVNDKGYKATRRELEKYLPNQETIGVGEVYEIGNKYVGDSIKRKYYKAYKTIDTYKVEMDEVKSKPYDELMRMVGLKDVKNVVREIIDAQKLMNLRSKMGIDTCEMSHHMIFTGNPGSAKTTVARLIGKILREEDVLETGSFIECGRADLVGKYVGWTAPTIRSKFKQAKGGILFIDEAYSLVDDRDGSYGDEAITTIVQEMENHRDDVIVIFAGYPDKMERFLEKNEGLRSRIAFHLNFPDYSSEEMTDIIRLMISEKGFSCSDGVLEKCHDIFEVACKQKEFGNGRYARNLLEQALMAQAKRVLGENKGKK